MAKKSNAASVSNSCTLKMSNNVEDESLLIDLRSPGDPFEDKTFPPSLIVKLELHEGHQDEEDMERRLAEVPDTPSAVHMLRHLPPHASALDVGAFADCGPGQGWLESCTDSPLHGSCLTPSQLYTPTGSPHTQIRKSSNIGQYPEIGI